MESCADLRGRMGPILAGHAESPSRRSLVLELHGDEKIVVPVIDREPIAPLTLLPPQRNFQDNLMVAVHPTVFCDAGELGYARPMTGYEESVAAPLRTGWVYVFFHGRLWRELFVVTAEESAPLLRDTDLARFRRAGEEDRNERPPVGPELDTVHLPARLLGRNVYDDVELAFSDTQWSWQHIEALEANDSLRASRCRNARAIKGFLDRIPGGMFPDWHRVDELVPMRARDNPLERDIFMPNQWLRDIDGSDTQRMMDEMVTQRDAIESDEAVVDADMDIYPQMLVPRWRHLHLKGEVLPEITEGVDVFETLRNRHLLSLTLRDPLFAARHLIQHMNESLALLLALVDNIKKRPHGVTAELFHNNFRREVLPNGSRNPLLIEGSWFDNRLDDSEDGLLLRTVYEVERAALRRHLIEAQGVVVRLMEDTRAENLTEVLRDLFNAEPGNDVAGYVQAGPLLQALTMPVGRADPLLLPQDAGRMKASGAEELNESLMVGEHPLAALLLPFKDPSEALPGDATGEKLRTMVGALQDREQPMRVAEANVLRSLGEHFDQTSAPDIAEIFSDTRFGMHALSAPLSEVSQWWLAGVQETLMKKGAVFEAKVSQVKGAFEGFAEAAIPGKTTLHLTSAEDSKLYTLLDVVDEQGHTLTSGAAMGATLKLADNRAFGEVVRRRPVGQFFHTASVSPTGLPPFLVVLDLFNFMNAVNYSEDGVRYGAGVMSAFSDLLVSSGQLLSVLPKRTVWLDKQVGAWKQEAKWFSRMSGSFNSENRFAHAVVRNKLQAAGWIAGMFTVSIMVWDAAANAFQGRLKLAAADMTKAVGVGVMTNSDIIAGRILTPMGRQLVHRTGERAVASALLSRAATAVGWGGTVSAGWVTVIGLGIYGLGEWLYYEIKDDAISNWLRGGPFSGNSKDQLPDLRDEESAYVGLLKSMMPMSVTRVTGSAMNSVLQENNLSAWQGTAESVFSFSAPALAISGEPVTIEWELEYERTHYQALGRAGTETLASRRGTTRHVDYRFDGNHTIHLVVSEVQLPEMVPNEHNHEYVTTRYSVKSLELSFQIKVWDRQQETYTIREVSEQLTDMDIKHHARG
ncbi:hypothetical protein [Marinobacter arenosus]|uniref:hypothetical protein n=1 Tax=Marinobacter arenosus TaxID=2856822 RepID=UPI001C4D684A|nr:hypothetical protein [Marinobacter arenosus]MBW0147844.1 hypothetical protein [Marinobacter arenosus]